MQQAQSDPTQAAQCRLEGFLLMAPMLNPPAAFATRMRAVRSRVHAPNSSRY
jgi:hypothetical protein